MRITPLTGPLKAAVIGAGVFGRFHAQKYQSLDGVELAAVADFSKDARKQITEKFGCPTVADWHDLLGKVDLVTVATPAVTHAEIVHAFLNSGANVLVEKPIATTLDEADALIAIAEGAGKVLTVDHQERFVFNRTGLLGWDKAPKEVHCWRMGPWSGRGADVSIVLDLMIHDLDLIHQLVPGEVSSVSANGLCEKSSNADEVAATLNFGCGTTVKLTASRIAERQRGMRVVYDDGAVEIDFLTRKIHNSTPRPLAALKMDDPLGESVAGFVRAVKSGTSPLVKPREARNALASALMINDMVARSTPLKPYEAAELLAAA